ncbi:MAG: hypothetical protein R3268_06750, partial [Acidiferrobacterales bacterium]|nr:hypothetical protein [Acidiferrobacterales bacterium]
LEGVLKGELGFSPRKMHPGVKAYRAWFRKYDQYHAVAEAKVFQQVNARMAVSKGTSFEEVEKGGQFIGVGSTKQEAISYADKRYRSSVSSVGEDSYKLAYSEVNAKLHDPNTIRELRVSNRTKKFMGLRIGRFAFPESPRKRK